MHRLRHPRLASKLRSCSLLFIALLITTVVFFCFLIATAFAGNLDFAIGAGVSLAGVMILWLLTLAVGNGCRCQLCQSPMMAHRKCSKHRNSKKLMGSYRLKLSTSFLLSDSFSCPYCGESFTSKVVEKTPDASAARAPMSSRPISHNRSRSPQRSTSSSGKDNDLDSSGRQAS